jgi:hypothetical protein
MPLASVQRPDEPEIVQCSSGAADNTLRYVKPVVVLAERDFANMRLVAGQYTFELTHTCQRASRSDVFLSKVDT